MSTSAPPATSVRSPASETCSAHTLRPGQVAASSRSLVMSRLADYLELTKPRIAVMVLITVTIGYLLGSAGAYSPIPLLHALAGIALVAAASSALNQYFEQATDARMDRTADRPLPAGRLLPIEVLLFGITTGTSGFLWLLLAVNPLTAWLCLSTLILYAFVYTPLKRSTSLCTAIGAIPGALPPVLGWTAAGGQIDGSAFALFAIMYLWQFPHFLAIAWLYRRQYSGAGLRMLPARSATPGLTGWMCIAYALALLPVSFLPERLALAGTGYLLAAALLGIGYLLASVRFAVRESVASARGLLYTSLIYLPLLLLALTWDHLRLLQ